MIFDGQGVAVADVAWDAEIDRVAAVRALGLLDTPPEERFDRITRLARDVIGVPIALLTLVDVDRQWFKSAIGVDHRETPRSVSLCAHAIRDDALLEVPDAARDPRFADNPSVTGPMRLRFYAGQPISAPSGHRVGTLCVVDRQPRRLNDHQRQRLADLAKWAELECAVMDARRTATDAERVQQDFVAVVSHELRTPLTSVHSSLELLASGRFGALDGQAQQLVDIAARNTDRLVRLANDVLDLSRVRTGRLRLRLADVAMADVVDAAIGAVAATSERAGVALVAHSVAGSVRGDADRLVQVVTNLLANAVEVSRRGELVEVWCDVGDAAALLCVRDRGPGVPPEQLDRIFEPFVQLAGTGRGPGGAGLGLAITRGVVEAHGGAVTATSTPGGGSTFAVSLPLAGPAVDRPWW